MNRERVKKDLKNSYMGKFILEDRDYGNKWRLVLDPRNRKQARLGFAFSRGVPSTLEIVSARLLLIDILKGRLAIS